MRAEGRPTFEEWARARQQHLVRSAYLLTLDPLAVLPIGNVSWGAGL